jgi:hypothetical protein
MESVFQLVVPDVHSNPLPDLVPGFQAAFMVGIALCLACVFLAFMAKDAAKSTVASKE